MKLDGAVDKSCRFVNLILLYILCEQFGAEHLIIWQTGWEADEIQNF